MSEKELHRIRVAPSPSALSDSSLLPMANDKKRANPNARNLAAFWLFGVFNNFVYIIMLAAAQDILSKHEASPIEPSLNGTSSEVEQEVCIERIHTRECTPHSAGIVLFCNIFPALVIKFFYPVIAYRVPYGVRHTFVCVAQAAALVIVALADSVPLALTGVMIAAVSNGLGESTFLALASHYSKHTIATWASGTGMAGMAGAFTYAGLTDPHLMGLSPSQAMLSCLVVSVLYFLTYFFLLEKADTVRKVSVFEPKSWIGFDSKADLATVEEGSTPQKKTSSTFFPKGKDGRRRTIMLTLLKYMIPLFVVYWAEYFINQGLVELIVFDCAHGYETSPRAQYRWYQVLYQIGVFISRSSTRLIEFSMFGIILMPILQVVNVGFFFFNAVHTFVPNFGLVAGVVFYEGLIGGAAYVNTYNHIHKNVEHSLREFSLSIVTLGDTSGIVTAALTAIPAHNAICAIPFH